jgi:acyl carrier protein
MDDIGPLQDRITRLLRERAQVEAPSVDADLMASRLLDSLTLMKLLVALEEEFGVSIPLTELKTDRFRTIARIAEFIHGAR